MNVTYKELSAWISAAVLAAVYAYYFHAAPTISTRNDAFGLFVGVAILIVIVEVVTHILAAILHRPEKTDERDRLIGARAYTSAYYVLATGIMAVIFYLAMPEALTVKITFAAVPQEIMAVHFLVLTCAVAEFVKYGTQIVSYRRDA